MHTYMYMYTYIYTYMYITTPRRKGVVTGFQVSGVRTLRPARRPGLVFLLLLLLHPPAVCECVLVCVFECVSVSVCACECVSV